MNADAQRGVDEGLRYLRQTQLEDGSWSHSVGITGLALRAYLESHRTYNESDGAFITRPVQFILGHVNEDGSISETAQNENYNTAVAMVALKLLNNPAYDEILANAQKYLLGLQIDEGEGYAPEHRYYGGIGYGGDERPDLSNQYMAMEALRAVATDAKSPVWERALIFINRSQNRSESNDQEWAANDGGFTYMPGFSPHGETGSYGGMTHAGLISLIFAGVDKNDPRAREAIPQLEVQILSVDRGNGARDRDRLHLVRPGAEPGCTGLPDLRSRSDGGILLMKMNHALLILTGALLLGGQRLYVNDSGRLSVHTDRSSVAAAGSRSARAAVWRQCVNWSTANFSRKEVWARK